jgi:hypothetical protein
MTEGEIRELCETFFDAYQDRRRRTYDDRIVDAFHDGFVIRYQLHGVQNTGHRGSLWICIVGRVRDGRITRLDADMDAGRFAAWAGAEGGGT